MARGGHRYGAGRPGWKAKAEQSLPLGVREMHRAGVLRVGYSGGWKWKNSHTDELVGRIAFIADAQGLALSYSSDGEPRKQYIPITHSRCHFGGVRPWFTCPVGAERVAVLYIGRGRFACRRCNGIAYMSQSGQSDDVGGRAWRKQAKIERRLGGDWERPKGMHKRTYDKLLSLVLECEAVRDACFTTRCSGGG